MCGVGGGLAGDVQGCFSFPGLTCYESTLKLGSRVIQAPKTLRANLSL